MLKLVNGGAGMSQNEWDRKKPLVVDGIRTHEFICRLLAWRAGVVGCPRCQRMGLCSVHEIELDSLRGDIVEVAND